MPYLADEAELMIHNLILYLRYKHDNKVLLYFTKEAKQEVKEDGWNETSNRVIFVMDAFLEEEIEDNIGLLDIQSFIKE